jgi:protein-tyrosine phosphatase
VASAVAASYGLSLEGHVPRLLTRELVATHDMVIVMEAAQLQWVRAVFPEFRQRLFLLSLYDEGARGAYERCNITDPFGQPVAAFEVCYVRVARALEGLIHTLPAGEGVR